LYKFISNSYYIIPARSCRIRRTFITFSIVWLYGHLFTSFHLQKLCIFNHNKIKITNYCLLFTKFVSDFCWLSCFYKPF